VKVKKYRAPSMNEAMKLIRKELGNDAIILNSRVIQTDGFLGFFKKRSIEVVAALDTKPTETAHPILKEYQKGMDISAPKLNSTFKTTIVQKDASESEELMKEISQLKSLLRKVKVENENSEIPLPEPVQELKQLLIKQGIHKEILVEVIKMSLEQWYSNGGKPTKEDVFQWAREYLMKQISHLPFGGITFTRKYINVVGPTGVGKTTTLAKIAADCILQYNKRIAFITTDTYRIAAIEQLKTYANILNVPIEVCYNLDDFKKAMVLFESYDLVFIDTAGRNFRNRKYVEDLKNIIDFKQHMETFLVLSLTSKQIDMEEIFQQFSTITIDKLIFTKSDETSTFGAMFNMIYFGQKAAAYMTNGQNVPEDMVVASPQNIVNRIIGVD
jgi:flagellar biosynthesis protein FlhF